MKIFPSLEAAIDVFGKIGKAAITTSASFKNLSNVLETLIIKNENIPKNLILMKTENETKIIKVED